MTEMEWRRHDGQPLKNEWTEQIDYLQKDNTRLYYENKRLREALESVAICSSGKHAGQIAEEALKEPQPEPDITITCPTSYGEGTVQDVVGAMQTLIPTKYKFAGHVFSNGTHTLTYRRA